MNKDHIHKANMKTTPEEAQKEMESIQDSPIECVDEIQSQDPVNTDDTTTATAGDADLSENEMDRELERETRLIEQELRENSRPKLTFKSGSFVHSWSLASANTNCICGSPVTSPCEKDLANRQVTNAFISSRCGCSYHTSCINEWFKRVQSERDERDEEEDDVDDVEDVEESEEDDKCSSDDFEERPVKIKVKHNRFIDNTDHNCPICKTKYDPIAQRSAGVYSS